MSEIAAYRLELQRTPPRASQFMQRLLDQQRAYVQRHAQADREAIGLRAGGADAAALSRDLAQRHRALAQQQLADATALLAQAREAMTPRFAWPSSRAPPKPAKGRPAS